MTIYEIKRAVESGRDAPYFFSKETMRWFGQTLRDFRVRKLPDGKYLISAPMRDSLQNNKFMGTTRRIFDPETKTLTLPPKGDINDRNS